MNAMRKCLVAVQGPMQFIAGFMAMEWYGHIKHNSVNADAVLLLFDFGAPPELEKPLAESIMLLSKIRKWDKVVFISSQEMRRISHQRYNHSIREIQRIIGDYKFGEIYVARDHSDFGNPLIINAYPNAARILCGESFGVVGNEDQDRVHWDRIDSLRTALSITVRSIIRGLLYGCPSKFPFDAAVLALPVDWSGSYLNNLPLCVPSREYVVSLIMRLVDQLPELRAYCESLIDGITGDCYLYLLGNFTNAGVTSIENEIALYQSVIKETAPKGATIFLKNHPRSPSAQPVINSLIDKFGNDYNIKVIDDTKLSALPIELYAPLIKKCNIVSVCSSSAINICYIYSKQVIIPLDDDKITTYCYNNQIDFICKINNMFRASITALEMWDGKTPLWKG